MITKGLRGRVSKGALGAPCPPRCGMVGTLRFAHPTVRVFYLFAARKPLDQAIEVFAAIKERLHRHALVLAVRTNIVHVARKPGVAVSGNSGVAQVAAVGG